MSLSVLGLIAALTLPSIFNSVNKSKFNAQYKETYNSLQTVFNDAYMNEGLPQNMTQFYALLDSRLNAQKLPREQCPKDGFEALYTSLPTCYVLATGATVWPYGVSGSPAVITMMVDVNGPQGPNNVQHTSYRDDGFNWKVFGSDDGSLPVGEQAGTPKLLPHIAHGGYEVYKEVFGVS